MAIIFEISSYLQFATGNPETVELEGDIVGQCLDQLTKQHPTMTG